MGNHKSQVDKYNYICTLSWVHWWISNCQSDKAGFIGGYPIFQSGKLGFIGGYPIFQKHKTLEGYLFPENKVTE